MNLDLICAFALGVCLVLVFWLVHIHAQRNRLQRVCEENRKALADATEAKAAKTKFLATMSHEIRTPLNAVIGFSECLARPNLTPSDVKEFTDGITRSANALLSLLTDILDLSRLEMGQSDILSGSCDVAKLFSDLKAVFADQARAKGVELRTALSPPDVPKMLGIAEQRLRQVLLILMGNAVKFTEKGFVEVALATAPCADGTCSVDLVVRDTGVGIPADVQADLFNPFVQSINDRGGKVYQGSGLGLPIVHRLVTSAGGTLALDSTVGEGSAFTVHFDHVTTDAAGGPSSRDIVSAPAVKAEKPLSDLRVVIADDVPLNLRILALHVRALGVTSVSTATSTQEALDLVRAHGADIVLTDVWMPGMSGAELVRILHDDVNFSMIPVVAVTADADSSASFDMSVFHSVVTKPVTLEKTRGIFRAVFGLSA